MSQSKHSQQTRKEALILAIIIIIIFEKNRPDSPEAMVILILILTTIITPVKARKKSDKYQMGIHLRDINSKKNLQISSKSEGRKAWKRTRSCY